MSSTISFFLALGCSLVAGYFSAFLIFRKPLLKGVTHLKLIGFLAAFSAVFIGLMFVIGSFVSRGVILTR